MIHKIGDTVTVLSKEKLLEAMKKLTSEYNKGWSIYQMAGEKFKIKKIRTEPIGCSYIHGNYYVLNDTNGTFAVEEFLQNTKHKLDILINETP